MRPLLTLLAFFAMGFGVSLAPAPAEAAGKRASDLISGAMFSETERVLIEAFYWEERKRELDKGYGDPKDIKMEEWKAPTKWKAPKWKTPKWAAPSGEPASHQPLPPGLVKHVDRNGVLPPGLQGRNLPEDLSDRLPRRSRDYERVIIDNDVVLVETSTRRIVDVLKDVIWRNY